MNLTDTALSWRDTLCAGDIVAFAFPSSEGLESLEKARPSLVLAVNRDGEETTVTVAYGTSRRTSANVGLELHVRTAEDLSAAGLRKRTRFIGARTVTVALSSSRFVACTRGTAVLGRLPPQLRPRLEQVVALAGQSGISAGKRGQSRSPYRRRHRLLNADASSSECTVAPTPSPRCSDVGTLFRSTA